MRVFMCEFVTGGGMRGEAIPPSLAREGLMMRDALARDLSDLPGVSLVTTHDDRLPPPPVVGSVAVAEGRDVWRLWAFCAEKANVVWPIAPETDGVLSRLAEMCEEAGATLVGPDCPTIAIASSKRLTAERLIAGGVAVAPVWAPGAVPGGEAGPFVVKPDDGAGCLETRLAQSRDEAMAAPAGFVVQRHQPGEAASLTVLCADGRTTVLSVNRQHVSVEDGAFRFHGLSVGALDDGDGRLERLARAISDALPGLDGIFGVDVALGPDGPVVIEINPRLTTSYAGLRAAIGVNPASLVRPFAQTRVPAPRAAVGVEIAL